jgi:arsenite/tail-anchored protein-transporting ATPase
MKQLGEATRNFLFTGKGGVGKTSIACATAISLADSGKRVLLVSTDPASNLDEVLATALGIHPVPVQNVRGLFAMNVDPEEAAKEYRERVVAPYRELLPEAAVKNIEEQLSGGCTLEIAAFEEFAKLLGDVQATKEFDHVIFDTAPTGHTLRLLQLPSAWSGFIETNVGGTSCLGPLAGLQAQHALYENTVSALSDAARTTIYLVSRPETSALAEAERTCHELEAIGLRNQRLIVNGMFRSSEPSDVVAQALERRGVEALVAMPKGISELPRTEIQLVPRSLIGIEALRFLGEPNANAPRRTTPDQNTQKLPPPLAELIPLLATEGKGVIMTMGKGGVGKTTIAAAVAVALARLGFPVHLTTTDPAAHLAMTVGANTPGLTVSRIDPVAETLAYTEEVLRDSGESLDEKGRALLEEDLRSPCTEEIAIFRAFAQMVDKGNQGFVVIDTAPTGHTLLLLDAANAYHRDVERNLMYIPESVRQLIPQLRNPDFTKILIVTLPEATPVHEAERLQEDLQRAGITPYAWVINQSFYASGAFDPVLAERGALELRYIDEVQQKLAKRLVLIPWQVLPPIGAELLQNMLEPALAK